MRYLFGLVCIFISPFILLGMAFPVLIKMLWEDCTQDNTKAAE